MSQKQAITHFSYDVVGRECPAWAVDACPLRKQLSELQMRHKNFGYKILENGNLLVPKWYAEEENGFHFNLNDTRTKICMTCYRNCRDKHQKDPEKYSLDIIKQVVILAYQWGGTNCPKGMSIDKCQLCKQLAEKEETDHIGYKRLGQRLLLIPNSYWNPQTNVFIDVSQRHAEICYKCFEQNREK